ncbi:MAG: multiheme c-type cytochrome [Hyphomicrobiaceae bacterium]
MNQQRTLLISGMLIAGLVSFAIVSTLQQTRETEADGDAVAALRDYVSLHQSLVRHPQNTGDKTPQRDNAWSTELLVSGLRLTAQKEDSGSPKASSSKASKIQKPVIDVAGLGIPSKEDKKKAGQTDDLLVPLDKVPGKSGRGAGASTSADDAKSTANSDHLKLFVENRYPSAATCGVCHPKHYREWSVSQHAYAQLSPVYLSLSNRINQLSNGSNGDFCLRCHSPVGANLGESAFASNLDRHPTSREGITCVVCHRINKAYNKASGRLALVEGGLTEPVFGPQGNKGVKNVLAKPEKFRVVTDPKEPGRQIHTKAKVFEQIKTPVFCGTCHDVTLFNGFRLEEAYSEYRVSPAAAKGITCQDCHMGKIQGKPSGYEHGPAALVGDQPTKARKLTSHLFSGPDYSLVHPGIFPHNQEAAAFKTMREWLMFKHKEGWGTDKFEDNIPAGYKFPKAWESVDDRYDAREILNKQFKLLDFARIKRLEVLRNGFILGDVFIDRADNNGLAFRVQVRNGTDGHNVPTGFTGERLIWLETTVRDRDGTVVYRSGDRDPNGDLRDGHSSYVHAGKIKLDRDLFSLQSIFVTQNGRGGEIEHVIPIPYPTFALPRVLPSTTSLVFTGEPATERNHKKGIEPNGARWASYSVDRSKLTGKPPYKAHVRLLAQPVPVNLILGIQKVGFDYGMTPKGLATDLIAGTQVLWERKIELKHTAAVSAPASGLTRAPAGASKQSGINWNEGTFGRD